MNPAKYEKSCWNCLYQQLGGIPFFGVCSWFESHGKGENKEIKSDIVDKGCKLFKTRNELKPDK